MPNTHCLPSGSLATGEMPVPSVPYGISPLVPSGSPPNKRGVVFLMGGLVSAPTITPQPLTSTGLTLGQNLQSDGWVVVGNPVNIGADYVSNQALGVQNLLNNDGTHGTLYANATYHWWDHCLYWAQKTYGAGIPCIPVGTSWGGYVALLIATGRTSTIPAYCAQVPATSVWLLNPHQVPSVNYLGGSPVETAFVSGSVTMPLSANTTINVTGSTTGYASSGSLLVQTAASDPYEQITYASKTSSSFVGCNGGTNISGNLGTGNTLIQSTFTSGMDISLTALNALGNGSQGSTPVGWLGWETQDNTIGYENTVQLYNNANGASQPVTSHAGTSVHTLDAAAVTAISDPSTGWFHTTVDPLCPASF